MFVSHAVTPQNALIKSAAQSALETVASVRSHFEHGTDYSVPLPTIEPESKHFKYASLMALGVPNAKACEIAEITVGTAEGYRRRVCKEAEARYGYAVDYRIVAKDIIDYQIALLSNKPIPSRLTGKK